MSKLLLTAALVLGSLTLVSGSARAGDRWYGPFDTNEEAHAAGDYELSQHGAVNYGTGYFTVDPSGRGWGEGYYVSVHYPDPGDSGNGLLGVPLPQVAPADPAGPGGP